MFVLRNPRIVENEEFVEWPEVHQQRRTASVERMGANGGRNGQSNVFTRISDDIHRFVFIIGFLKNLLVYVATLKHHLFGFILS